MASLSTLGGALPTAMQDIQAFGAEEPILDRIRAKRMEREKMDLEQYKATSLDAYYKSQSDKLKADAEKDDQLKQVLQNAPKIDQSSPEAFTQSLQSYVTHMFNSGYPDIAKDTLTHLDNLPNIVQPGARTERAETMAAERGRTEAQARKAEAEARQLEIMPKRPYEPATPEAISTIANLIEQRDPAYSDLIPFNEPRKQEIRLIAEQVIERLNFYKAQGGELGKKTLEEVLVELYPEYGTGGVQQGEQPTTGRDVVDQMSGRRTGE